MHPSDCPAGISTPPCQAGCSLPCRLRHRSQSPGAFALEPGGEKQPPPPIDRGQAARQPESLFREPKRTPSQAATDDDRKYTPPSSRRSARLAEAAQRSSLRRPELPQFRSPRQKQSARPDPAPTRQRTEPSRPFTFLPFSQDHPRPLSSAT